jgi:micrococcal nuclease
MKRVLVLIIFLTVTACVPAAPTLIPAETAVVLTMAALPPAATPTPANTNTPMPPTITPIPTSPTDIDVNAPGAYCIPTDTNRDLAIVTRVLGGAAIEVAIDNMTYKVKYIGLDAPEISPDVEWQGPQAVDANEKLVVGRSTVLIKDVTESDEEGFLLRYVFANGVFVNYELLRQGYARALIEPPDTACQTALMVAQKEAFDAKTGVWSPTPIPTATVTSTPTITPIPSTPTFTLPPPCNCERRYTCNDFSTQDQAQSCYDYCTSAGYNIGLVDKNGNGLVCEGLD